MRRLDLNILDVIGQPMFGQWFPHPETWRAWFAFLAALFALPMTPEQLAIYRECTGRSNPPSQPHREAWIVAGRRSGKSFALALISMYLSVFRSWQQFLAPGERATIMVVSKDRDQAGEILNYLKAYFGNVPMLRRLVESETAESIELTNRVRIQVNSASSTRTRGYAIACALLDEAAFWSVEIGSAVPDKEILAAIRPGQAQFGSAAMLLVASSPYARKGMLWEAYCAHYGQNTDPVLVWKAPTAIMNPCVPKSEIDLAFERDPADAASEFGAEFRTDVQAFVGIEAVLACTDNTGERLPRIDYVYTAFTDPSGGSSDSMTLAIAHMEGVVAVIDCVREVRPPFSPGATVAEFAKLLHRYSVYSVWGDRYAGEWPREQFLAHGITYEVAEQTKSDLYLAFLPMLNSRTVGLIDHARLQHQLVNLERRVSRGGRDLIDHVRGAHDDLANACAGAAVLALQEGASIPPSRLQGWRLGSNRHTRRKQSEFAACRDA